MSARDTAWNIMWWTLKLISIQTGGLRNTPEAAQAFTDWFVVYPGQFQLQAGEYAFQFVMEGF